MYWVVPGHTAEQVYYSVYDEPVSNATLHIHHALHEDTVSLCNLAETVQVTSTAVSARRVFCWQPDPQIGLSDYPQLRVHYSPLSGTSVPL